MLVSKILSSTGINFINCNNYDYEKKTGKISQFVLGCFLQFTI